MDFWASLEHDLKYKAVRRIEGVDAPAELKECSQIIEAVENRMAVLASALEGKRPHSAEVDEAKSREDADYLLMGGIPRPPAPPQPPKDPSTEAAS